tara:strand:+ start:288 stop:434 length:147 start_codon:yes stop_codon:yes gene_type:complete
VAAMAAMGVEVEGAEPQVLKREISASKACGKRTSKKLMSGVKVKKKII